MLALNATEAIALGGLLLSILSVVCIPIFKWIKKKINKIKEDREERKQDRLLLQKLVATVSTIGTNLETLSSNNLDLQESFDEFLDDYGEFTIQNYKYMINDAFFGYDNIHEIPDEVLINACECCDIYVNKKHRNHEIKPRCKLLWDELERRSVYREVTHE